MNLVLGLSSWVIKKFGEVFGTSEDDETTIRVDVPDQVYTYDKKAGFLATETTSVTTTAIQIEVPSDVNEYMIVHRTAGSKLYYGDENVTTSDNDYMEEGDILIIKGKEDFEIYGIADTGTIKVFVIVTSRS